MSSSPGGRRLARRLALATAVTGLAVLVVVPAATGGTGVGSVFNLGRTNSVNKPTVLTGSTDTRMLQVTNGGSGSWAQQNSGAGLTYTISTSGVNFRKATTGTRFIVAAPDLPISTFGEAAQLRGFELCFMNGANTTVSAVELAVSTTTDAGPAIASPISDTTVRAGADCALFTLPTPAILAPSTKATLFVTVNWGVAGQDVEFRGLTFVLGATGTKATPLIP